MFEFLDLKKLIHYRKFKVFLFGVIFLFKTLNAEISTTDNHLIVSNAEAIMKHSIFTSAYIKAMITDIFQYQFTNSAITFLKELIENDKYHSYLDIYRFLRRNADLTINVERFYKVIDHEHALEDSKERQNWHSTERPLSESIKSLQVQEIPTHPDPEKLYEVVSLLDSLPHDFESMDKIAQGVHHLLATTTLIDKQNSVIREIFIDRRLKLYIENLNGDEKFEFTALLYEKILPVPMQHRFKKQIPNRDLNQYTGTQLIKFIETYISIYDKLFSFHHEYTKDSQYALFNLAGIRDLKISSITLNDMSSFLELIHTHNKNSENIFIETVAQKIVYLILSTNLFLNKEDLSKREDSLYSIFSDHLNAFYLSLSQKDKINLMQNIARQIKDNIKTSSYFESLLEKEIQTPLLSFQDYVKIFCKHINKYTQYRKSFIDNEIKETGSFIQPRKFYQSSRYHALSLVLNLTPHQMHRAAKQLNYLMLNTNISVSTILKLSTKLTEFSDSLSPNDNKQFKKLIVEEMIESIDLSDEFTRFLKLERMNPNLSIKEYFDIYKHLINRYHDSDYWGYVEYEFIPLSEYPIQIEIKPEYLVTFNEMREIKNLLEQSPQYKHLSIAEIAQKISQFLTKSDFLYLVDKVTYEYFFKQPFEKYLKMVRGDKKDELCEFLNLGLADSLNLSGDEKFKRDLIYISYLEKLLENYRFLVQNSTYYIGLKSSFQASNEATLHQLKEIKIDDWLDISYLLTLKAPKGEVIEKIIDLGFYTDFFFIKDNAIKDIFFKTPFDKYLYGFSKKKDNWKFKKLFLLKLNEKLRQIEGFQTLKDVLENKVKITKYLTIDDCMTLFEKVMEEVVYQNE